MHKNTGWRCLAATLLAMAIVPAAQAQSDTSRVLVTVNGEPITLDQLKMELSRRRGQQPARGAEVDRQAVLDDLIQRRLFAQQAVNLQLDSKPQVIQALQGARSEVLANAYAELQAPPIAPSLEEVRAYYEAMPALFSQRRIYMLQELSFLQPIGDEKPLLKVIRQSKSITDVIRNYAEKHGLKYKVNAMTQPAEALPLSLLDTFASKTDGDLFLVNREDRTAIFLLVASRKAPSEWDAARPLIEQFLVNRARNTWVAAKTRELKAKADIKRLEE